MKELNSATAPHTQVVSMEDAIVLAEGFFGESTGKTANGLVRFSRKYRIVGGVDSTKAGQDAGDVLDGERKGIPIFSSVGEAISSMDSKPKYAIVGVATVGGYLPKELRAGVEESLRNGLDILSGLHEYLGEDSHFRELAEKHGARIYDIRKPRPLKELRQFSNEAGGLDCLRIPFLGTDGSIGKRTAALLLTETLNSLGIKTTFVATGQTGLLQGAEYGVPLDSIKGDYMVGELEGEILRAYRNERPKVIVIEGQGSISHQAYVCGTRAIINASHPSGILLQHAPGRKVRNFRKGELNLPMPEIEKEIEMLEYFSGSKVIGLGINHENLSREQVDEIVAEYEERFGIPACDPLWHGIEKLAKAVMTLL